MSNSNNQTFIFPLLLSNFIGTLGFSLVLPFLVFLVLDFGGNSIVYGIIAAVYPAFQLIGAPLLGKWSDIVGRKKILLLSNLGTCAGWIIFFIALLVPTWTIYNVNTVITGTFVITLPLIILFLARGLDGITGGNISVANAYLSDVSTDKDRGKNFGKMAISSNLGFIIGPALAGILGATKYEEMLPVLSAVIISFLAVIVIAFKLKESKTILPIPKVVSIPKESEIRKVFSVECKECYENANPKNLKIRDVFKLKNISFLLILNFVIFLGFNVYYTSFPIHAVAGLKWSIMEMGIFYSVLSGLMAFIEGPVLKKALQKYSEEKLVIVGSLILSANFALFVFNSSILAYSASILFAIGNGLMWPSFMSILSKQGGNIHQGAIQGVASSMASLASIIGLIMGGLLYDLLGNGTFLISAFVLLVVFIISFKLLKLK